MILVLRALGIGDLATAVPALRGLRAAFPDRPLALAAPAWLAPLVDLVGCVDRLLPVDGLGADRWSIPAPWLAVNLHGRGPRSHRLLRAAASERLWAFRCPAAGHGDGPRWAADEHEVRRWCRLLHWYGVPADPADLGLRRPARADPPSRIGGPPGVDAPPGVGTSAGVGTPVGVTVVHPGGKEPRRRWAPERFAAVARELAGAGHRVVITGSAAEGDLARRVAALAGLPAAVALAGRFDLAGLAALVAGARLVISADTGVAHLATAYGTPSVVLFGPVPPARWGPPPDRPRHRVLWTPPESTNPGSNAGSSPGCRPAPAPAPSAHVPPAHVPPTHAPPAVAPDTHPGLAAIGVGAVLTAAEEALRAADGAPADTGPPPAPGAAPYVISR